MDHFTKGPLEEKSVFFAVGVVRLHAKMQRQNEFTISKQLLRAGTSIGAQIQESRSAESRRDFLHKIRIAAKEAREAHYWLRVIQESKLSPKHDITNEISLGEELVRMLTAAIKTTSKSLGRRSTGRGNQ